MSPLALFWISIGLSFIAWGIAAAWYLWPELRRRSRAEALLTHGLVFWLLLRGDGPATPRDSQHS
jgi:hypothetical protein